MKNYQDKVAFITGGAMGIGFAIAKAFAADGMKVMLADINLEALNKAVAELQQAGADVAGVICDVTKREAIVDAANKTLQRFGKVHVVVNNAGVLSANAVGEISPEKWQWTININQMSVIHGCEIFLPLIRTHGEGGHIVNTASVAGHVGYALHTPYNTTKFAVVGYTEALSAELKDENISVSVLCPGVVKTNIANCNANNPDASEEDKLATPADLQNYVEKGMSADTVALFTLEQMKSDALFIFPKPATRLEIQARFEKLMAAFDAAEKSPLIQQDPGANATLSAEGSVKKMV